MLGIVLFTYQLQAQTRTLSGKVTDANGNPVPNASIIIKGTRTGTTSNAEGKYSLSVPSQARVLVFSSINLGQLEATIGNQTNIDVSLTAEDKSLQEVVVVGYGTQKRGDPTASVATINAKQLADKPVQSFDQALSGKAPGLNVIQPNGVLNNPPVIRIRGFNSITGTSSPLIVVDGMVIFSSDISVSTNSSANNPLGDINPADIESISVLKDAAATAVYGSRAANGVLIITTKKGKKGRARINYDTYAGWTSPYKLFDVLNAQQYVELKNEARANRNLTPAYFLDTLNGVPIDTKWSDYIYRTGFQQNHSFNVSGANDNTRYYMSVGYSKQQGMIVNNDFERKQIRLSIDQKVNNWLNIGTNMNFTRSSNFSPNTGSGPNGGAFNTSGAARLAFVTAPVVSPYLADGSYNLKLPLSDNQMGRGKNLDQTGFTNPVILNDLNSFSSSSDHLVGTIFAEIPLFKGLKFKTQYGVDYLIAENKSFSNPIHGDGLQTAAATDDGTASNDIGKYNRWVFTNQLTYDNTFWVKHSINVVVAAEQQSSKTDRWSAKRSGVSDPFYNEFQGGYTLNDNPPNNLLSENYLLSYLGRISYDFDKRYFLTVSLRRDAYSGYSPKNIAGKWGTFPGVAIGYSLSKEKFWQNTAISNVISDLRVRASYGKVGNIATGDFQAISTYASGLYGTYSTLGFNNAGNPDLKWETSKKTDVGLSFGLFNGRLNGEVTYYNNNVDNIVLNVPTAASLGLPGNTILKNIGKMYNRGIEINLNGGIIQNREFTWNASFNITTLANKVTELAPGVNEIVGQTGGLENTNLTRPGYSIGSFYTVRTAGVNPANGNRIFIKRDGTKVQFELNKRYSLMDGTSVKDLVFNDEAVIIGQALPKLYGGFTNNFTYKGLDMNVDLFFNFGNYVYNGSKAGLRDQRFWNNSVEVYNNRWKKAGDITNIPRVVFTDNISNGSAYAISENIEKGDFLKFRNISIGYTLKDPKLEAAGFNNIRFYVQVQNAITITSYTGIDPEISSNGNSNIAPGVDRNVVPQARTISVGLNVGF